LRESTEEIQDAICHQIFEEEDEFEAHQDDGKEMKPCAFPSFRYELLLELGLKFNSVPQ
jgi:hypothetical protein